MKQLLFLSIFCFIIWNIPTTAQKKIVVKLTVDEPNFVDQLRIDVSLEM